MEAEPSWDLEIPIEHIQIMSSENEKREYKGEILLYDFAVTFTQLVE